MRMDDNTFNRFMEDMKDYNAKKIERKNIKKGKRPSGWLVGWLVGWSGKVRVLFDSTLGAL